MNNRWKKLPIVQLAAVVVTAALLSSCGKGKTEQAMDGGTPRPQTAVEVLHVGTLLPLTGPAAQIGQDERDGIRLASAAYTPTRRRVEFTIEDSQLKPATAVTIAKRMLDLDGVRVFWATTSGVVLAVAPAMGEKEGDVLLFAEHTVPNATEGFPFMYRFYPSADAELGVLSEYAIGRGYKRVGAFCLGNQAGELSLKLFRERMEAAGIQVPVAETFAYSQADYRQTLEKFKHGNVDAMLIMGYTSHYKPIFRQMLEIGLDVPVLGGVATPLGGIEDDIPLDFLKRVTFPGCRVYYAPDSPVVASFRHAAQEAGVAPNYEVAYAYDLATTIQKAVDAAETGTAGAIAAAVSSITPFEGITGRVAFDQDRDIVLDLRPCTWPSAGISLASE